jgi:hypothetical protein
MIESHIGEFHARLPGMADVDQSFAFGIALPVKVLVPSSQLREEMPEELLGRRFVLGMPVHVQHRCCVEGRLHDPRSLAFAGGVGATLGVPEVYAGKVLAEA